MSSNTQSSASSPRGWYCTESLCHGAGVWQPPCTSSRPQAMFSFVRHSTRLVRVSLCPGSPCSSSPLDCRTGQGRCGTWRQTHSLITPCVHLGLQRANGRTQRTSGRLERFKCSKLRLYCTDLGVNGSLDRVHRFSGGLLQLSLALAPQ